MLARFLGGLLSFNFSANPPIANGQANQSAKGMALASPMATPSLFSSGSGRSLPERSADFNFVANPPIVDGQVNHSAAGLAPVSQMATTPTFRFGNAGSLPERSAVFSFGANPSATGRQTNHSEMVRPAALPSGNGLTSVSANGHSYVPCFNFATSQWDIMHMIPTHATGPVNIIVETEARKTVDNGKKKKQKRRKKQGAAKPKKHVKGDIP
ncbi:hypothetical protein MTO96_035531 [Rhipicephalus appendiculatus]